MDLIKARKLCNIAIFTLREKRPNADFFWSAFFRIWTGYGDLRSKYWKIRTRKTPYLDTFEAVLLTLNFI